MSGEAGDPAAPRLAEPWWARMRARLDAAGRAAALPFLAAVAEQAAAHAPGAATGEAIAERALELLLAPDADAAARALVAEPPLFAAFFQNLDLLYEHADPHADVTAALVLSALELAGHAGD